MEDKYYVILAFKPERVHPSYVTILNEYNSTESKLCYMIQSSAYDATKFNENEKEELQKYYEDSKGRFKDRRIEIGTVDRSEVDQYGARFLAKDLLPHKKPFPKEGSYIYSVFTAEDGSLYVDEDIYTRSNDETWGILSFWTFDAAYQRMVKKAMDTGVSYRREED